MQEKINQLYTVIQEAKKKREEIRSLELKEVYAKAKKFSFYITILDVLDPTLFDSPYSQQVSGVQMDIHLHILPSIGVLLINNDVKSHDMVLDFSSNRFHAPIKEDLIRDCFNTLFFRVYQEYQKMVSTLTEEELDAALLKYVERVAELEERLQDKREVFKEEEDAIKSFLLPLGFVQIQSDLK